MKFFNALTQVVMSLPIIPVRGRTGGNPIGWASMRGMQGVFFGLGFLGLVAYFWFRKWYTHHPVWGKIIIGVVVVWALWWVIAWVRSFNEAPHLRKEPYRQIYLDEEKIQFNPMNEQTPVQKQKDETRS